MFSQICTLLQSLLSSALHQAELVTRGPSFSYLRHAPRVSIGVISAVALIQAFIQALRYALYLQGSISGPLSTRAALLQHFASQSCDPSTAVIGRSGVQRPGLPSSSMRQVLV